MPSIPRLATGLALLAAAGVAKAEAQVVAGWSHESASGIEFAYFAAATAELTVRCKGPSVEVVYYIDAGTLDPALKGLTNGVFAMLVDDDTETMWKTTTIITEPGVVSVGVGGQAANDLAHHIARASRQVVVSILPAPPQPDSKAYNSAAFPIYGAADAIKAAYAGCGIPF